MRESIRLPWHSTETNEKENQQATFFTIFKNYNNQLIQLSQPLPFNELSEASANSITRIS
jgi:hypothetical protein